MILYNEFPHIPVLQQQVNKIDVYLKHNVDL